MCMKSEVQIYWGLKTVASTLSRSCSRDHNFCLTICVMALEVFILFSDEFVLVVQRPPPIVCMYYKGMCYFFIRKTIIMITVGLEN